MSKHQQFDDYFDKYSTDIFTEHTEKHNSTKKEDSPWKNHSISPVKK